MLLDEREYDNLLSGSAVETVTSTQNKLAASQGDLKRGQCLELSGSEYIVIATAGNWDAVLAQDVADNASAQPITVYHTGEFNSKALITDDEAAPTITIDAIRPTGRQKNMHIKTNDDNDSALYGTN